MDTDASDLLPVSHLDLWRGRRSTASQGRSTPVGRTSIRRPRQRVVEALASGCLTTAFVWLQHRNPVRAVAASDTPGLRDAWLEPLCRGERRAGIALAGNRPGPPILRASNTAHGDVVLDGEAPWVSGWGRIDVILVTAREGDRVVSLLVDANESPTLHAEHLRLVGANASGTVTLRFHDHVVPQERMVGAEPHADVLARDATGLQLNGSLALGVVDRCCRLMGPERVRRAARRCARGARGRGARGPPLGSGGGLGACPARHGSADGRAREPIDPDRPASTAPRAGGTVPVGLRLAAAHQGRAFAEARRTRRTPSRRYASARCASTPASSRS